MEKARNSLVNVNEIVVANRARQDLGNKEQMDDLKASIEECGLIHPIALMEIDGGLRLLAGERRLTAIKELGWEQVPASIYPPLDEYDLRTVELHENLHRLGLSYADEVGSIRAIHELQIAKFGQRERSSPGGYSMSDTGRIIGVSKATVSESIDLAKMIEQVPELGQMRNKSEALKMMKKAKRDMELSLQAQEYEEDIKQKGEDKTRQMLLNSFVIADFLEGVKRVDKDSVHLVEIDPPYGIRLDLLKRSSPENMQGYIEKSIAEFRELFPSWMEECYRVMAPNSWLLCWFSIKYHFEFVASTLEKVGFKVNRMPCIWISPTGQTLAPKVNLASAYDTFFAARKGTPELVKQGSLNVFGTPPIPAPRKVHPTERPIELYQEILGVFAEPNSLIMVPFLGSGNTLLAASNLNMRAFGFEMTRDFRSSYAQKVAGGFPGAYTSLDI